MKKLIIFLFLIQCSMVFGQKEDHVWQFGWGIEYEMFGDTLFKLSKLDFNFDPPKIISDQIKVVSFDATHASICDEKGDLLFSSNGMQIYGSDGSVMIGGDTIAFDQVWINRFVEEYNWHTGKREPDQILILPFPKNKNLYYTIYSTRIIDYDLEPSSGLANYFLKYAIISFENNPMGEVISKDNIFLESHMATSSLNAIKHANGRDWWIIKANVDHTEYFTFLLSPSGINKKESSYLANSYKQGLGQMITSPDGTKILRASISNFTEGGSCVQLMNFNRCTGELTGSQLNCDFGAVSSTTFGAAFSPNSELFYISTLEELYQFNVGSPNVFGSKILLDTFDGYRDPLFNGPSYFGSLKLGPDNKIYIGHGWSSGRTFHVIDKPNKLGLACTLKKRDLLSNTSYVNQMPSISNFRLGPIDGSECDTLTMDNHPISKFRYEQDSSDFLQLQFTDLSYFRPEEWNWEFGDGNSSNDKNPEHEYEENGIYEVCLTVSNENSENTSCRNLYLGVSSNSTNHKESISVYPNPVQDVLIVSLEDYLPEAARVLIYDAQGGLLVKDKIYHGWNRIDFSNYLAGIYFYKVYDRNDLILTGSVVKVD